MPAVLVASEGSLTARGPGGQREIAAADLFEDYLTTAVAPDEWSPRSGSRRSRATGSATRSSPPSRGLGDGRRLARGQEGRRRLLRGRADRADQHGLRAAARDRRRAGAARQSLDAQSIAAAAEQAAEGTDRPPTSTRPPTTSATSRACRPASARGRVSMKLCASPPTDESSRALAGEGYLADRALATAVYLAADARAAAAAGGRGRRGEDRGRARARAARGRAADPPAVPRGDRPPPRRLRLGLPAPAAGDPAAEAGAQARELFGREFLLRRPLLEALEHDGPAVLLIDEVDRADDEFEAFLLEFLADFAITIPELGTITARGGRSWCSPPTARASCTTRSSAAACTTGSTTRRASARRRSSAPAARRAGGGRGARVRGRRAAAREELYKLPGVGETITWARALLALDADGATSRRRSAWR